MRCFYLHGDLPITQTVPAPTVAQRRDSAAVSRSDRWCTGRSCRRLISCTVAEVLPSAALPRQWKETKSGGEQSLLLCEGQQPRVAQ